MARILPDGWQALDDSSASARRQLETLHFLDKGLSDAYTVYHAVHWSTLECERTVVGEIDFVIVNRAGDLLLIEQKMGFLSETPEGLVKAYPGKTSRVAVEMARSAAILRTKLSKRPALGALRIASLLYCPHYHVKNPLAVGIAEEMIVDATRRDRLVQVIEQVLPPGDEADTRLLHHFLRDIIELESDVSALMGQAREMVTRVSGGLAHWARQLRFSPYRLRVTGTAGSGKTQLALAEFRATLAAGGRPLYVCFNRPLADHFAAIAGDTHGVVCTFHALCERLLRHCGQAVDFSRADAFAYLEAAAQAVEVPAELRFDTVIVDEGQDFSADWRDAVLRHAEGNSRLLWLEDPLQNLYGRAPVELPGWVGLETQANYRSPRAIVRFLRRLAEEAGYEGLERLVAASPMDAQRVDVLVYEDVGQLAAQTKLGLKACFAAGFRREDVALVSFRGRENSLALQWDRLGDTAFRRFTGAYDLFGQPLYSNGEVVLESVYRFKGQSAPAVVLCEIDCERLDERTLRKLFVGATRASMKLVLVMSAAAARCLADVLQSCN